MADEQIFRLILIAGFAIITVAANWFILLTGGSAWLVIALRTNKKEENLIARFGDEYRGYMERTGRFFPRL